MGSVLLLGFVIGLRHAIEADHVAAVASLTSRSKSLSAAARLAAAWGLGHTLMLFAVASVVISLDSVIPEQVAEYLKLAVGMMLVWLGFDVLKCQRRSKSTPLAGVKMHHLMRFSPALAVVPVVHRRDPRCFV